MMKKEGRGFGRRERELEAGCKLTGMKGGKLRGTKEGLKEGESSRD